MITVPGWMKSCTSRVTKVSLVRSGTQNVRARPLPLSTIPNTHAPSETRPRLYLCLCPNIDSSISTVFPLPPSLMLPCRIFREQICDTVIGQKDGTHCGIKASQKCGYLIANQGRESRFNKIVKIALGISCFFLCVIRSLGVNVWCCTKGR